MSPSLFAKLYAAAQHVADHAVLTTTGLEFAPYPVVTLADKTTFYEQAILQFYEQHQVDYETYLTACWEYRHRPEKGKAATLDDLARQRNLSPRYLHSLYEILQGNPAADQYYIGWLRGRWNSFPAPTDAKSPNVTAEVTDSCA